MALLIELEKAAGDASIRHVFVTLHVPLVGSGPLGPGPRSGEILAIMRQSRRSFVEQLDFRTSPGSRLGVVVTDLAVYRLGEEREMEVASLHPGVTRQQLRDAMAWEPRWAEPLGATDPPSDEELRLIREELDPAGVYTR